MRLTASFLLRILAPGLPVLAMLVLPGQIQAQTVPDNFYRAEFVVFERIVDPDAIAEQMADRDVAPTPVTDDVLWSVSEQGEAFSTLKLAPKRDLYLKTAAQRLENSGRYRVLMTAGWYQHFPPGYQGRPLRLALGDWIADAGLREIEGTVTIRRQRYLLVSVELNHWRPAPQFRYQELTPPQPALSGLAADTGPALAEVPAMATDAPLELVTWIRETRRMRSGEVHLLDSPTIGVLVYFRRVGDAE